MPTSPVSARSSLSSGMKPSSGSCRVRVMSRGVRTRVSDIATVKARLAALADRYKDGNTYTLDGFSAEFPDWHFNVRGSNTEPMLRLNLEALTPALMATRRDEVLAIIRA